jgi:hypothetical protein
MVGCPVLWCESVADEQCSDGAGGNQGAEEALWGELREATTFSFGKSRRPVQAALLSFQRVGSDK